MTGDTHSDTDVSTEEAFNAALTRLLARADAQGVDVEGAWVCRSDADGPDWEAAVVELDDGH